MVIREDDSTFRVVVMVEDTEVDMIRVLEDTVVMEDRINIR